MASAADRQAFVLISAAAHGWGIHVNNTYPAEFLFGKPLHRLTECPPPAAP